jgi:hypothetical protein
MTWPNGCAQSACPPSPARTTKRRLRSVKPGARSGAAASCRGAGFPGSGGCSSGTGASPASRPGFLFRDAEVSGTGGTGGAIRGRTAGTGCGTAEAGGITRSPPPRWPAGGVPEPGDVLKCPAVPHAACRWQVFVPDTACLPCVAWPGDHAWPGGSRLANRIPNAVHCVAPPRTSALISAAQPQDREIPAPPWP